MVDASRGQHRRDSDPGVPERPASPQFPVTDPDADAASPPRTRYPVRRTHASTMPVAPPAGGPPRRRPNSHVPEDRPVSGTLDARPAGNGRPVDGSPPAGVVERRLRRRNSRPQNAQVPPETPEERTLPGVRAPDAARQVPYRTDAPPGPQSPPPDVPQPPQPRPDVPKAPRIADPVRYEPDGTVVEEPAHAPAVADDDDDVTWHPSPAKKRRRRRPARHRRHEKKPQRPLAKELPILVVTALVLTFVIQTFIARVYMIPSGSMETTLHGCDGCTPDRVLVDKVVYHFEDPKPGDVVVFKGPDTWHDNETEPPPGGLTGFLQQLGGLVGLAPADESDFVKRIIAVGGQTIRCCDKQNRVVVDGKPINELSYLHLPAGQQQQQFGPWKVPPGRVFVMGDNRNNSADSRIQGGGGVNGTVPVDNIIGKARFIVLPPSRWGSISDINPQEN